VLFLEVVHAGVAYLVLLSVQRVVVVVAGVAEEESNVEGLEVVFRSAINSIGVSAAAEHVAKQ